MSNFLVLNLQDFGLGQDITQTIRTCAPLCVCCLDKNTPLVNLQTCEHAGYLQQFGKPETGSSNQLVCTQCHAVLKKIEAFRRQVEESYRLLSIQAHDLNGPYYNTRAISLAQTQTEVNDFNEIEVKTETNVSEPIVTIHEGLREVKKVKRVRRKAQTTDVKPRLPLYKRFEGKIRVVSLTQQEMQEERAREEIGETFLKFPYRCTTCILGFDHEPNYNGHMQRKHSTASGPYVCAICKTVLTSDASLKKHVKNHYQRFECLSCGKRYINVYSAMQHCSTQHGGAAAAYRCQSCDFVAQTISAYAYHRNKHRKNLQCTECGKMCTSSANLKTHLFAVHKQSGRTYTCPPCGKSYNTKSGLQHHAATRHATKAPPEAYCVDCNAQFNSVRCYKAHLRLNSKHITKDSKKFACAECGSKFVTNASMKRHHEWVHLKLFRHQCTVCMEGFRTRSLMLQHKQLVHDKVPPARNKICQYCGKGFKTTQVLRSHIRTHTGERPLRCDRCAAAFAHSAALYTHRKLVHKIVGKATGRADEG